MKGSPGPPHAVPVMAGEGNGLTRPRLAPFYSALRLRGKGERRGQGAGREKANPRKELVIVGKESPP